MSRNNFELRLTRWLDEGPESAPSNVVEAALRDARTEGQVGVINLPWPAPRRIAFPPRRSLAQFAVSAAAIVLAVGLLIFGISNRPLPPASSPTPVTSPTSSSSPSPTPSGPSTESPQPATNSPVPTVSTTATPFFTPPVGSWRFPVLTEPGEFDDLALAVDDVGRAYVAASIAIGAGDSRGIVYLTSSRGSWAAEQVTTAPPGQDGLGYDGEPDIAVAPDGTVWIAFTRYECAGCTPTISSGVYVINNGGGSWSKPEQVGASQSYDPSIAVNSSGAHLAYSFGQMPGLDAYPGFHASNELGSWTSTQLDDNSFRPQIALGRDDIPLVAYGTPRGVTVNSFVFDSAAFSDVPGPTGEVNALFFTVDKTDRQHVIWEGANLPMQQVIENSDGGWSQSEDVIFDGLQPDTISTYGENGGLISAARSVDQPGAWFVNGTRAAATLLAAGETVKTDVAAGSGFIEFVYSYTGAQGEHGIWWTETGSE
jgi:hypothetical protein